MSTEPGTASHYTLPKTKQKTHYARTTIIALILSTGDKATQQRAIS